MAQHISLIASALPAVFGLSVFSASPLPLIVLMLFAM